MTRNPEKLSEQYNEQPEQTRAQAALGFVKDMGAAIFGDSEEFKESDLPGDSNLRQMREEQHNRDFRQFANQIRNNDYTAAEFHQFMADSRRVGTLNKVILMTYRDQHELTRAEHTEYVAALESSYVTIKDVRASAADLPERTIEVVLDAALKYARQEVIDKSPDSPLPEAHFEDHGVKHRFEAATSLRQQAAERQGIRAVVDFLQQSAAEIRQLNDDGSCPAWFDPQRMHLAPGLAEQGFNLLHNQPIDPYDDPKNIGKYLETRLEAYREIHPGTGFSARSLPLLKPYLESKLAENFDKFDPGEFYYIDDGPINYTQKERILFGPVDDPQVHASTSYCRAMLDCMMNKGIANDLYMNRPDLLAMSLARSVLALERLARYLNGNVALLEPDTSEPTDHSGTSYPGVIRFEQGTHGAWDTLGVITHGLTDNTELREHINDIIENLQERFRPENLQNPDSPLRFYSFIPQTEPSPDIDYDEPFRVLMREALSDLQHAQMIVADIDLLNNQAESILQRNVADAQRKLEGLVEKGWAPEAARAYQWFIDNDIATSPETLDGQTEYEETTSMVSKELHGASLNSFDSLEQLYNHPQRTAMYDSVMRRLAHTDFLVKSVSVSRQ